MAITAMGVMIAARYHRIVVMDLRTQAVLKSVIHQMELIAIIAVNLFALLNARWVASSSFVLMGAR
jgi:hypothetical protein